MPLAHSAHQLLLLRQGEGTALAGALQFDELAQLVHHAVQVHLRPAVLAVLQVQHGHCSSTMPADTPVT